MQSLSLSELRKRPNRIETLAKKLKTGSKFDLVAGGSKVFTQLQYTLNGKTVLLNPSKNQEDEKKIIDYLKTTATNNDKILLVGEIEVTLTKLAKTTEFGGGGASSGVSSGAEAQNRFANLVESFKAKDIKIAKKGSAEPDVIFTINGITEQAEIKSSERFKTINIFDITVFRKGKGSSRSTDIEFVDNMFKELTGKNTLEDYIDLVREKDPTVGYKGDPGVTASHGSLSTKYFKFDEPDALKIIIKEIKNHWKKSNDDYFVINSKSLINNYVIFRTGVSKKSNLSGLLKTYLNYRVPNYFDDYVESVFFRTYGDPRTNGKMRMQFEVTLRNPPILIYDPKTIWINIISTMIRK